MRRNRSVAFVGGAAHSGSTLLGLVLGAHPDVFYAGEANKSEGLGDARVVERKRTCKVCGRDCVVWSAITADESDLYEALSVRTDRPIVVDSTKSIAWIDRQLARLAPLHVALHLFFLGRDGRAVVASGLRKRPETSARDHARAWVDQITATEALAARFPGAVTRVSYEELATRPDDAIARVATAIGVKATPEMREPWTSEQHPLGGNAGALALLDGSRHAPKGEKGAYYGAHPRAFVLDLRWKNELSREALDAFDAVAGDTNRAYAFEGAYEGSA